MDENCLRQDMIQSAIYSSLLIPLSKEMIYNDIDLANLNRCTTSKSFTDALENFKRK